MTETNQPADVLNWNPQEKKLPDMLNVLTILTFVGCGLMLISSLMSFFNAQTNYDRLVEMQDKADNMPDWAKRLTGPEALEMTHKALENKVPILLLSLLAVGLSLAGAVMMRGRKKTGFTLYLLGEILPIVTSFVFLGLTAFGGLAVAITLIFPAVFIILYATQLKALTK